MKKRKEVRRRVDNCQLQLDEQLQQHEEDEEKLLDDALSSFLKRWEPVVFNERFLGGESLASAEEAAADLRPTLPDALAACFLELSEPVEVEAAFFFISCGIVSSHRDAQATSLSVMSLDATQHANRCLPYKPHYQFTSHSFPVKQISLRLSTFNTRPKKNALPTGGGEQSSPIYDLHLPPLKTTRVKNERKTVEEKGVKKREKWGKMGGF